MVRLETERLFLRPFTADDFEGAHAYGSVPENVRFMPWGPNDAQATRAFLLRCEERWKDEPVSEFDFAVVLKNTDKVVGGCGIYLNEERTQAALGWALHRDYWKKGLMPEAAKALLRFGFEELKLHRITAYCNTENYGSYRVMEKAGMRREGHFIKAKFGRVGEEKKWYDQYQYAMLNEEWARQGENGASELRLVFPTLEMEREALAYRQEYFDCGEFVIHGDGGLDNAESYSQWIEKINGDLTKERENFVASTTLFAVVGERIVGTIQIRHKLNDFLLQFGGHIGYGVRPSERRRGYASAMLKEALRMYREKGIDRVLVTCDKSNTGSARTILKNGGKLENEVVEKDGNTLQRYWINTIE